MNEVEFNITSLELPSHIRGFMMTIAPLDVLDILLVAIIIYKTYEMLEDTRAITLVKGFIVLLGTTLICNLLELHAIYWLLQKSLTVLLVALPIVFQPELRRTLEHLGQGRIFGRSVLLNEEEARSLINEMVEAIFDLAEKHTGALIVVERDMGLNDICATGVRIDGLVTAAFLENIFVVKTPLHDGAAVIRGKRVIAAGCILPLTNRYLPTEFGTRHRAGIGLSEQCDALIIIVSEETGIVSVAEEGHIRRPLNREDIRKYLSPIFAPESVNVRDMIANWRKK
ncbi:MAG: diadenylate cyclase CdaA [Schwartzia sp.]|nr:diadenylate cyclase CdaA [Schwartzia sp. (in: firmicutes)]